jgi:monoamine oxidase
MSITRRKLLSMIGAASGGAAMYHAMTTLGHAAESPYAGPLKLGDAGKGTSVLIIGAGLAGLTAAMELRKAGYKVQILEYNARVGGRSWTIRGGDRFTELGGETQTCEFAPGEFMNPGPWRFAHHHRAILDYCRRLGVEIQPFVEVNYNGYLHSRTAFGGKPQRLAHVIPDLQGHVAELLSKASQQHALDEELTAADADMLREVLKTWAGLDSNSRYTLGAESAKMRGYDSMDLAAGTRTASAPLPLRELLKLCIDSDIWAISNHSGYRDLQNPLFHPVGGMDMIAKAMAKQVPGAIRFNTKVTAIHQNDSGVTVTYEDTARPGRPQQAKAQWCICTVPFPILSQMDLQVSPGMLAGINAIPFATAVKVALQFKRRFWEQDDGIYGGFSHTQLPIRTISYPTHGFNKAGPGVLYGAFMFGAYSYEFAGMSAAERVKKAVEYGAQIHPQYPAEFQNGVSVAWHRQPFSLGCTARWTPEKRVEHYQNTRAIDGRIVLAGESVAAAVGGWQEGAILSALDVVERIHKRVVAA